MEIKTIKDYIEAQEDSIKPILNKVYDAIKEAIPEATEKISYNMPTFWKKKNIIHFAAHKNHLGIYPGVEPIVFFKDKLKDYKTSKGAIQFPYAKPLDIELIKEIAVYSYNLRVK